MAKDHARERNKQFYAKTKVSAFANFEIGCLIKKKKMEKNQWSCNFLYVIGVV